MYKSFFIGVAMLVACVVIQCFVVSLLLRVLAVLKQWIGKPTLGTTTGVLTGVMLIMVAGNVCQAAMWADLFMVIGELPDFATAFYFSFVNFTTLGYGDIVMSEPNRLLGAFEAGNGILMLGLTTRASFLVLGTAVERTWMERFTNDETEFEV